MDLIFAQMIDLMVEKAKKDQVEIEYNTNTEGQNIIIRPWKPFSYNCPYGCPEKKEGSE